MRVRACFFAGHLTWKRLRHIYHRSSRPENYIFIKSPKEFPPTVSSTVAAVPSPVIIILHQTRFLYKTHNFHTFQYTLYMIQVMLRVFLHLSSHLQLLQYTQIALNDLLLTRPFRFSLAPHLAGAPPLLHLPYGHLAASPDTFLLSSRL